MTSTTNQQRGSIMVLVMVILIALLSAGAVAVGLLVSDTRSANITNRARTSMLCAEAGLEAACVVFVQQRSGWNAALAHHKKGDPPPVWYDLNSDGVGGIEGDLDGDAVPDFRVTLRDNDETDGLGGDPPGAPGEAGAQTQDNRVYMVSECISSPEYPRRLLMLIDSSPGSACLPGSPCINASNKNNNVAAITACSKF